MAEPQLDVLLVAEALVVGVGWDELRAPYTPLATDLPCTQSVIAPQSVSVTWAMYLGSPVSASWLALCPQTNIIGRNTEGEQLTPEVSKP